MPAVGRAGCGRRPAPRSAPCRRPRRPRPDRRCGAAGRGRASGRPRRRAASGAARAPRGRTGAPRTRHRRRRTDDGPRRTRSGSARCASSSPPSAACAMTSAWLATTSRAWRAARTFFSTKHRRKCGQAEWMHSPRRSASAVTRPRPISSASQPGKSPPTRSPASVAPIQRAISASGADRLRRAGGRRAHRVLVIQQAEIILAALADHDAAPLLHRVGVEPVELAGDLALQVAGVGRDPHRALVLLGPQAGRRDIAERLADAGAGLGEHRLRRRAARAARRRRRPRRRNRPAAAAPRRRRRAGRRAGGAPPRRETGALPGGGGGARSCHSPSACQARKSGRAARRRRVGRPASAASTAGPQAQPARSAASAMARASGSVSACSSCSRARAAVASATQASAMRRPAARGRAPQPGRAASARRTAPAGRRRTVPAGRARRTPAMSSRRAVARAWHTIAVSPSSRARASAGDSASISPSGDSHMTSRNPATSAGARGTRTRSGDWRRGSRRPTPDRLRLVMPKKGGTQGERFGSDGSGFPLARE